MEPPLAGQVVIETVCNGSPHAEGYTDAKGYFSIQLGARNTGMIQDASEFSSRSGLSQGGMSGAGTAGPMGGSQSQERKYMGCDLQAKLAGYRSQTVPLSGRRSLDDPNIGTILMHRNGPAEEGQTISAVSLSAPKDAKKAYDKGMDAIKKKKFEDAQNDFEKAVEAYPKYATAWYELGLLQAGQGKMDMAHKYFDKASECDPKFVKPYIQISILELQASKWQGLADVTDKAGETGSVRLSGGLLLQLRGQLQSASLRSVGKERGGRGAPGHAARHPAGESHTRSDSGAQEGLRRCGGAFQGVSAVRAGCEGRRQSAGATRRGGEDHRRQRGIERPVRRVN